MLTLLTWSESSMPRWQAAHGLVPFKWRRMSPGLPRYVPLSMAAARIGAMLPIARCFLWLNGFSGGGWANTLDTANASASAVRHADCRLTGECLETGQGRL